MTDEDDGDAERFSSFDLAKLDEIKEEIRAKEHDSIEEVAASITVHQCELMGSGVCTVGVMEKLLRYFDTAPALIALATAKYSSKRVWSLHQALKAQQKIPTGSWSAASMTLQEMLKTLRCKYDELTFRRDYNWLVRLEDLRRLALGNPEEVIPNLIRVKINDDKDGRRLEVINPFNADIICGFGRLVCEQMLSDTPKELKWQLPIKGHYFAGTFRRKKKGASKCRASSTS